MPISFTGKYAMAYKSYESSRIAAKRCYERRKAAGKCADCAQPLDNNFTRCNKCMEKHKIRDKTYLLQGKCATCGKRSDAGRTCTQCRTKKKDLIKSKMAEGYCGRCIGRKVVEGKTECSVCREKKRVRLIRIKVETFSAYGGVVCACCGEKMLECLQLDHINNDGAVHRKANLHGTRIYRLLKKQGYPSGFQVLCANCNFAKGILGYCPHSREPASTSSL